MKKIFKYTILAVLGTAMLACTGREELDTDQLSGEVSFAGMAPNPVMRGAVLQIYGHNLSSVKEVQFAGDVTVSEFTGIKKGSRLDTLLVTVPTVGPEVGPVTIVTDGGVKASSFSDLEYTEPIEFDSFTPATALSRDVITIKGEYLNNVLSITFAGDAVVNEFVSKSRNELKVAVPANALSGKIIVSDVDKVNDQNTIPNDIYSPTDLTIGQPTVVKADTTTFKSGDVVTVSGDYLDMIEKVDLTGASDVEFTVAEDFKTLSFTLPASATDGSIVLTSFAGDSFDGGVILTKTVSELTIASNAEDGRYKAGSEVTIAGDDLDLVTKVDFNNGEASWYLSDGKIIATIPASAKDGSVTVTLGSGKQAYTPGIEVVKPVVTGIDKTEAVAGKDVVAVTGTDLDLVTGVTIGDKANSFIDCEFAYSQDTVKVTIPAQAYTGVLTLTPESGYAAETAAVTVSYDLSIAITYDSPSYALGKPISISGSNLLQIESITIKGKKVTSYSVRADDAMSFALPEDLGPGVYRLDIVLIDGTALTWPVPFEVTAPYTETFVFEGSQDLGSWSINWTLTPANALAELGAKEGDILRIYGKPTADWWQIQVFDGHWGALDLGLGNGHNVNAGNYDLAAGYIAVELDADRASKLTTLTDWGQYAIIQGENFIITGISLVQFGLTETVVWEGTSGHTGDYAANQELGTEDDWVNAGLYEGAEVRIYFTPDDPADWSIQVFDGHWNGMGYVTPNGKQWNAENSPEAVKNGYVSFIAEGDAYTALTTKAWWGTAMILQGKNVVFTKLAYM